MATLTPCFSTHSHPLTPFFNNSQPNLDNLSPQMTPFFDIFHLNFHFFFEIFVKYMCLNLYFVLKICQNLYCSFHLPPLPLFIFSPNDNVFFLKKPSLTERSLVLRWCPIIPVTSKSWVQLPTLPGISIGHFIPERKSGNYYYYMNCTLKNI